MSVRVLVCNSYLHLQWHSIRCSCFTTPMAEKEWEGVRVCVSLSLCGVFMWNYITRFITARSNSSAICLLFLLKFFFLLFFVGFSDRDLWMCLVSLFFFPSLNCCVYWRRIFCCIEMSRFLGIPIPKVRDRISSFCVVWVEIERNWNDWVTVGRVRNGRIEAERRRRTNPEAVWIIDDEGECLRRKAYCEQWRMKWEYKQKRKWARRRRGRLVMLMLKEGWVKEWEQKCRR